jgi:hypothetical protein
MTPCIKSLQRNGSPSGKEKHSGRPVDVTYCILEHGNQDPSVGPLRNWMLYSQTSHCKLDNQGNLSKYWPCACKPLWTHGKADYGRQEEHWSQKSNFGTLFDSAGRMDSGPMFQMMTHPPQYQFVIMQAIEWNLNVWR